MHVLDFMVKSRLKILKGTSVECMECLNEDAKKKRTNSVHQWVGMMKLLLVLNWLDIKYKLYGFSGDLIET